MEVAGGVFRGVGAFFEGVRFVLGSRRLWWRAAVPAMTALVLAVALVAAGVHFALPRLHAALGYGVGETLVAVLLVGLLVVVAMVIALALARPLSGWALDGIVRAQRRALAAGRFDDVADAAGTDTHEVGGLTSMAQSTASSLLSLVVGVPPLVGLAVVGWLFPPAAVATVPLDAIVAALILGWDLLDYPLSARGMSPTGRARWCAEHFGAFLGFGLAASVFFAIPVVGWFALPFGVAGATRLAGQLTPGRVPSPPGAPARLPAEKRAGGAGR
jgi:CysZ protein